MTVTERNTAVYDQEIRDLSAESMGAWTRGDAVASGETVTPDVDYVRSTAAGQSAGKTSSTTMTASSRVCCRVRRSSARSSRSATSIPTSPSCTRSVRC